jgi:hypothetical protein
MISPLWKSHTIAYSLKYKQKQTLHTHSSADPMGVGRQSDQGFAFWYGRKEMGARPVHVAISVG